MRKLLSLLVMLTVVLMASIACQAGKKASGVEGKVVDANGKPLAGIKVVAKQKEPFKGYEKFETKTKQDGSFSFKGLYPESAYAIAPEGIDQCTKKSSGIKMKSAPAGEMKMLEESIVVRLSPLKLSKDGVITDPRTNLEWATDPGRIMTWDEANQYAQGLSLAGGGWRLPSLEELRTLYDMSCDGHIIHSAFNLGDCWVWSSQLRESSYAWYIGFGVWGGKVYTGHRGDDDHKLVLPVRSGR